MFFAEQAVGLNDHGTVAAAGHGPGKNFLKSEELPNRAAYRGPP